MYTLGRLRRVTWLLQLRNFSSSQNVPASLEQISPMQLYGMEMDQHQLPFTYRSFKQPEIKRKMWQQFFPNNMVWLVKKSPEQLANISDVDDPEEKFYKIASYCKINYGDAIGIDAVFKVRIHSIIAQSESPVGEEKIDESEVVVDVRQQLENMGKKSENRQQAFFRVTVEPVVEQFNTITSSALIGFKYIMDTYQKIFPSKDHSYLKSFNAYEMIVWLNIVAQNMINGDCIKTEIAQRYFQLQSISGKINILREELLKTLYLRRQEAYFEQMTMSSIRNKRMFEYYSQMIKHVKLHREIKSPKDLFIEKARVNFDSQNPTAEVKEIFYQELKRLMSTEESSSQYGVCKRYVEDLSKIPYGVTSEETYDLDFAKETLEEEHYGMKEVKDFILEIIAVGNLKGTLKGKALCLVGGPGLGKTTIAKSIAKALKRKFYSISLGGVHDSTTLKGHRRTYVGAYSGKIIEALKICECNNPVILLDQIDKMGRGGHGDPRSELLQILDPNQNSSFLDNYIDVPVDLSNVLFICSANYIKRISKPLRDRLERIYLSSFTNGEKKEIFKRHILRRAIEKSGVPDDKYVLNEEIIDILIDEYSRGNGGVRQLETMAQKIFDGIALKIEQNTQTLPIVITRESLTGYVGTSYMKPRDHTKILKGVAISLSGGENGSRLTYIEAFKKSFSPKKTHKRGVMYTGSLGDIFKEAMDISYTYARNYLQSELQNQYLYDNEVHIHAPEGGSAKNGSTDSLTISTALISLATDKEIKKGLAMTGELTLQGKILRTNGIKEKVLVAQREKLFEIVIPQENLADVDVLPDEIKKGMKFHYVRDYKQVYKIVFE